MSQMEQLGVKLDERVHTIRLKSDLLICLKDLSEAQSESPVTSSIILDGAVIVQMLKPATVKYFAEYASQSFIAYIFSQLQDASRVDLVWNRYIEDSRKTQPEQSVGKEYAGIYT